MNLFKSIGNLKATILVVSIFFIICFGILIFPPQVQKVITDITGYMTFAILTGGACWYAVHFTKDALKKRLLVLAGLLGTGLMYFLYLAFGFEAWKFVCSSIGFDIGTSALALSIIYLQHNKDDSSK